MVFPFVSVKYNENLWEQVASSPFLGSSRLRAFSFTVLFLDKRDKLWLNRHDFLVLYMCSEFKLDDIRSTWVIGCWEYLLWSKFLREKCLLYLLFAGTLFCGSLEKSQKPQKLEPAKISCHKVLLRNSVKIRWRRRCTPTTTSQKYPPPPRRENYTYFINWLRHRQPS